VERVWEGTQNVLALDALRVIQKSGGAALNTLITWSRRVTSPASIDHPQTLDKLERSYAGLQAVTSHIIRTQDDRLVRHLERLVGFIASTTYAVEHAQWTNESRDWAVVDHWLLDGRWSECLDEVEKELRQKTSPELERQVVYGAKL